MYNFLLFHLRSLFFVIIIPGDGDALIIFSTGQLTLNKLEFVSKDWF